MRVAACVAGGDGTAREGVKTGSQQPFITPEEEEDRKGSRELQNGKYFRMMGGINKQLFTLILAFFSVFVFFFKVAKIPGASNS